MIALVPRNLIPKYLSLRRPPSGCIFLRVGKLADRFAMMEGPTCDAGWHTVGARAHRKDSSPLPFFEFETRQYHGLVQPKAFS